MAYVIRPVKAAEWQRLRELRLAALADPVARVAFNETLEEAAGRPTSSGNAGRRTAKRASRR